MPAITALAISTAAPFARALKQLAGRASRGLRRLAERVRNRHETHRLAALDDRMLADIGLNRSDLRDAFSELPWRDPSEVLARRAAERRGVRRLSDFAGASAPLFVAPPEQCYPRLDRKACHLM